MPNHVTSILKISHEEGNKARIKECLNFISSNEKDEDGEDYKRYIDFNKIIPMPKSLHITSGTSVDNAVMILKNDLAALNNVMNYPWVKDDDSINNIEDLINYFKKQLTEKNLEEGRMAIENEKLYGHRDWYSWSNANWGTKWNAYSQTLNVVNNSIKFDTAWSTPLPVIEALSLLFPDLTFLVEYADEDLGSNCGTYEFVNGVMVKDFEPENPLEFACKIKDYDHHEIVLDRLEYDDIDSLKKKSEEILEIMMGDSSNKLIDKIKEFGDGEETDEKICFLKRIALDNELYEFIMELDVAFSNRLNANNE